MIRREDYGKLVRDKIPSLLADDKTVEGYGIHVIEDKYKLKHMRTKLREEIEEYFDSKSPDELVDILEIIFAIAEWGGINKFQLLDLMERKGKTNGVFDSFYYLRFVDRRVEE